MNPAFISTLIIYGLTAVILVIAIFKGLKSPRIIAILFMGASITVGFVIILELAHQGLIGSGYTYSLVTLLIGIASGMALGKIF